jgi:hypothetical protein
MTIIIDIIYICKKTWSRIVDVIYKYYLFLFSIKISKHKQPETIIDETHRYIKTEYTRFIKRISAESNTRAELNINIDRLFYSKQQFTEMILNETNTLENMWKTRILFETTPRGNIIMYYDCYKQGFSYYSDMSGLPYVLLNAVAMKYVRTYRCLDFFVDNELLSNEKESPLVKVFYEEEKSTESKKTDQEQKNASDMKDMLIKGPFIKYKKQTMKPDSSEKTRVVQIEYIRNKFISLGKIVNFNILQKCSLGKKPTNNLLKIETSLQKVVMNYRDYKNIKKNV